MALQNQYNTEGFLVGLVEDYGGPMPHNAASEVPPQTLPDGSAIPVWHKYRRIAPGQFELVEDYRGCSELYDSSGNPYRANSWGPLPDGVTIGLPQLTLGEARANALEILRLKKWERKDAGITVNGIAIDTDDKGQATINGAVTNILINPNFTTNWKTSAVDESGTSVWLQLDKTLILAISSALTSYTEDCFAVEAGKQLEIATLGSVEDIYGWLETELKQGWPSQTIVMG